jgi:predicted aldo/keto reductase-like oxidoreductase
MPPDPDMTTTPARYAEFPGCGKVPRLALATRGNTHLTPDDVLYALDQGITVWNWCGYEDGMSAAVRLLGARRDEVVLVTQFEARTAEAARRELDSQLETLGTDRIDCVTYYYVEEPAEWEQIHAPGGAAEVVREARASGVIRAVGITSHQRHLAAEWACSGELDLLMIRYNAAHRGAEREVFPVAGRLGLGVIAYTGLRWGALLRPTRADPAGTELPAAVDCYRFQLEQPAVTVALMAPDNRAELEEDLLVWRKWRGLSDEERERVLAHGRRVRAHAGGFP